MLSCKHWMPHADDDQKMRQVGNANSNKIYNPKNTRPSIPMDVDEVDSSIERFLRLKYDQKAYATGAPPRASAPSSPVVHFSGGSNSDESIPGPPVKTRRRFGLGLRSASSALPTSRDNSQEFAPQPPRKHSQVPSPIRVNKQSRVFGASIGVREDGLEWKLVTLKEMGFPDDKRNSSILKGLNGNLERAIESLMRLGEGSKTMLNVGTPSSGQFSPRQTPSSNDFPEPKSAASAPGISFDRSDTILPTQELRKQSYPMMSSHATSRNQYNPFDTSPGFPEPQSSSLETAFQNMQVAQPLFPNLTGGHPQHGHPVQDTRAQQAMTPPVPQLPQEFFQSNPFAQQHQHQHQNPHQQQVQQQVQPQVQQQTQQQFQQPSQQPQQQQQQPSYNPFYTTTPQATSPTNTTFLPQAFQTSNPYAQPPQQLQGLANNPYQNQGNSMNPFATQQGSSPFNQGLPQQAVNPYAPSPVTSPNTLPTSAVMTGGLQPVQQSPSLGTPAAFWSQNSQAVQFSQPLPPSSQLPSPQQTAFAPVSAPPSGRFNTSSILALYAQAPPAPLPLAPIVAPQASPPMASPSSVPAPVPPQRSVTMPVTGSKNPFARPMASVGEAAVSAAAASESGRHSPDAFASLSARWG